LFYSKSEVGFNTLNMIYQFVKPSFDPDVEYMKDPLSGDITSVDNSLFIFARKLKYSYPVIE